MFIPNPGDEKIRNQPFWILQLLVTRLCTHTPATLAAEYAQTLWGWLEATSRLVPQGEAQGSRNTREDEKFKKRLLFPIPVEERPLSGKRLGIWVCGFAQAKHEF